MKLLVTTISDIISGGRIMSYRAKLPLSNYPPGAEYDPRAPWNQVDYEGPWTYTVEMSVHLKSPSNDTPQEIIEAISQAIKFMATENDWYEVEIEADCTEPEEAPEDDV